MVTINKVRKRAIEGLVSMAVVMVVMVVMVVIYFHYSAYNIRIKKKKKIGGKNNDKN